MARHDAITRNFVNNLESENARLKAEVERLTEQDKSQTGAHRINTSMWKDEVSSLRSEVERLTAFTTRTIIPNEELKAQVERLTKAGDAMASSIQFNEEMAQDYNGPTIVHKSVQRWRDAKEGKQS
jgi:GAF domain-containing protein